MSFSSKALAGDQRWLALSVNDRVIVDRLASDLFRTHIYVNQISAPEWRYLNPAQKAPFRRNAMDILGARKDIFAGNGHPDLDFLTAISDFANGDISVILNDQ